MKVQVHFLLSQLIISNDHALVQSATHMVTIYDSHANRVNAPKQWDNKVFIVKFIDLSSRLDHNTLHTCGRSADGPIQIKTDFPIHTFTLK